MAEQGEQFRNCGPATKFESARDVTSNSCVAHEITNNFYGTFTPPIRKPSGISFTNIPEPYTSFTGRVEFIKSVIKYLSYPVVAEAQIQFPFLVIHAFGGYGKTQTARKIASVCRKEHKFQHFIWIESEDHENVKKCFVAVMIQVGLKASVDTDALNFDLLMHQFYNLLTSYDNEKFLIIFDNVEDFNNILKFLPLNRSASNLAVLMTSRHSFTRKSFGTIENKQLHLMLEEEAIELVKKILNRSTMDSEEDKKLLVERSGRIALVLFVMTSTIKYLREFERDYRIKDYLEEMGDKPIQYRDKANNLDLNYDKCLQNSVRFAVDKLNLGESIKRIAVYIFDLLAYLPSTNDLKKKIFQNCLSNMFDRTRMELPIKPVNDVQVFKMAIKELCEFSLAQIVGNQLTVHRWIQASRRLDLKASGDGKAVLKKVLLWSGDAITWEHVVTDYPELLNELYVQAKSLEKFPIYNIDVLEKVIPVLTQTADFQPFDNYARNIEDVICHQIVCDNLDGVKRAVKLFNYDMQKSTEIMLKAISHANLEIFKWLVDEKLCIPKERHLCESVLVWPIERLTRKLKVLNELSIEITEKTSAGYEFEFDRSGLLRQPSFSQRIEWIVVSTSFFYLVDSDPLKIHLCKIIERYCGKDVLQEMFRYASKEKQSRCLSDCMRVFEIMRIIRTMLLERNIESDEISEIYSENNLLECLFFCGISHFTESLSKWRESERAKLKRKSTEIEIINTLLIAVEDGTCEATTVSLESYSGDVNAVDFYGETALSYAIKLCHPSICKILLGHGARTHWMERKGASVHAIHIAVETLRFHDGSGPDQIINAIVTSKDCDVCAVDHLGNNILHLLVLNYYATRYKPNNDTLKCILSACATLLNMCATLLNMQNNEGFTPLQLAISLRDKFSDDHWHRASLQCFISMIEPIATDAN